ncbi:putative NACHT LRR and PYD domains-containing protein 12-like [Scophthalmus maximus]|uniref:Putative NACHT LRR and PYD domains-containing protein 12-like n=1 Tax=Scophthalmus maximus TaxID=52904 RepID=A0A2U9CNV4_SCOMX|nr:putative NACHT LRR and PYD domains-containing protein 12-like [Scophthalmus maximus]
MLASLMLATWGAGRMAHREAGWESGAFRKSSSQPDKKPFNQGFSVGASPLRPEKMSDLEEDEDRAESPVLSCVSIESDRSKGHPPNFSTEPGPSHSE